MTEQRKKPAAKRRLLMPTPNGAGFRALLGGEPTAPMTLAEAQAEIGRCIRAGREKKQAE